MNADREDLHQLSDYSWSSAIIQTCFTLRGLILIKTRWLDSVGSLAGDLGQMSWAGLFCCLSLLSFVAKFPPPTVDSGLPVSEVMGSCRPPTASWTCYWEFGESLVACRAWRWKKWQSDQSARPWSSQVQALFSFLPGLRYRTWTNYPPNKTDHFTHCTWLKRDIGLQICQRPSHRSRARDLAWTPFSQYQA